MSQSHMSQNHKIEKTNEIKRDCPSDFLTHSLYDSEFVELTLVYISIPHKHYTAIAKVIVKSVYCHLDIRITNTS
jgi:hypothetical protein